MSSFTEEETRNSRARSSSKQNVSEKGSPNMTRVATDVTRMLEPKFDEMRTQIESLDSKLESLDSKLDRITSQFSKVQQGFHNDIEGLKSESVKQRQEQEKTNELLQKIMDSRLVP